MSETLITSLNNYNSQVQDLEDRIYAIDTIAKRIEMLSEYYTSQYKAAKELYSYTESPKGNAKVKLYKESILSSGQGKQQEGEERASRTQEDGLGQQVSFSIKEILTNLIEEGDFGLDHLIYSFALFERYLYITRLNGDIDLEKLFSTAAFVAHKFLEDQENWFLPEFSKLTGIAEKEAQVLEKEFCLGIGFQLFINKKIYRRYEKKLRQKVE